MADMIHEVRPENIAEVAPAYEPTIYMEVSKEQLEVLEVGKNVVMEIKGRISGLEAQEDGSSNRYEIRLKLKEVRIDPEENGFSELADDD